MDLVSAFLIVVRMILVFGSPIWVGLIVFSVVSYNKKNKNKQLLDQLLSQNYLIANYKKLMTQMNETRMIQVMNTQSYTKLPSDNDTFTYTYIYNKLGNTVNDSYSIDVVCKNNEVVSVNPHNINDLVDYNNVEINRLKNLLKIKDQ